jgi:hypothetical protein
MQKLCIFGERKPSYKSCIKLKVELKVHEPAGDIGIPNGRAEDGTRSLLKAHKSKNMKFGSPGSIKER